MAPHSAWVELILEEKAYVVVVLERWLCRQGRRQAADINGHTPRSKHSALAPCLLVKTLVVSAGTQATKGLIRC